MCTSQYIIQIRLSCLPFLHELLSGNQHSCVISVFECERTKIAGKHMAIFRKFHLIRKLSNINIILFIIKAP